MFIFHPRDTRPLRLITSFFSAFSNEVRTLQTEPAVTETLMTTYSNFSEKKFIDKVKIKVRGGNGGRGCVTYYRDRIIRSGAPDGGSGGNGGDLCFKAATGLSDLHIMKRTMIEGNNGKAGARGKRDGKNGKTLYCSVPVGTLVWEIMVDKKVKTKEEKIVKKDFHKRLLKDLDIDGKSVVVARGGVGGRGNAKTRCLKVIEAGKLGEIKDILLELKCIADVGLVGLPNVGKSSILASVSRSLPKIANYPFTTLSPLVGKIKFIDDFEFTMADLPGIIEDAHKNKGLGLDFLRHIERTKVFLYVLDVAGDLNEDLKKNFDILINEIKCYKKEFLNRPSIVAVNKCDIEKNAEERFKNFQKECGFPSFMISAKHGFGLGDMIIELRKMVEANQKTSEKMEMK